MNELKINDPLLAAIFCMGFASSRARGCKVICCSKVVWTTLCSFVKAQGGGGEWATDIKRRSKMVLPRNYVNPGPPTKIFLKTGKQHGEGNDHFILYRKLTDDIIANKKLLGGVTAENLMFVLDADSDPEMVKVANILLTGAGAQSMMTFDSEVKC